MGEFALTADGRRIYVDPGDTRAQHLIESAGDFNPASLALWRLAVSAHAWDLVVDVGVNYGEMLVGVELPPGADVIGFEPNVSLHPLITRTCVELGIDLDLRAEAVSDRCGSATFAVDSAWSGTSTLQGVGRIAVLEGELEELRARVGRKQRKIVHLRSRLRGR